LILSGSELSGPIFDAQGRPAKLDESLELPDIADAIRRTPGGAIEAVGGILDLFKKQDEKQGEKQGEKQDEKKQPKKDSKKDPTKDPTKDAKQDAKNEPKKDATKDPAKDAANDAPKDGAKESPKTPQWGGMAAGMEVGIRRRWSSRVSTASRRSASRVELGQGWTTTSARPTSSGA
jgi:outer membrane biosynthesis protein TonB